MAKTPEIDLRSNFSKNYIINGDMQISQRFAATTASSIGTGQYLVDRFVYTKSGLMVHNFVQSTDVPTMTEAGYLFKNSLHLTLTTIDTSIGSSDNVSVNQYVEGYNWASLAQKPFTLSFWVKATLPGIYCVAFRNSGADRAYVAEYTINTTETWEYKTINVSASPSAGTWDYTTGIGLDIRWTIASGTDFHTTANAWNTGNRIATVNQVNGVISLTTSLNFKIAGVMLNEGSQDLPFRLFGGDIEGEIRACQRYYEKNYGIGQVPGTITGAGAEPNTFRGYNAAATATRGFATFLVRKRTSPTTAYYSGTSASAGNIDLNGVANASAANVANEVGTWVECNTATSGAYTFGFFFTANAEL